MILGVKIRTALLQVVFLGVLAGCGAMPFNKTPAELRSQQEAYAGKKTFDLPFDVFLARAYRATTECADVPTFLVSPDKSSATALIQMPGLSSVATILVADAKPAGNRTEIDVWLYFNNKNWQSRVDGYLAKVTNPDSCAVSSPKK